MVIAIQVDNTKVVTLNPTWFLNLKLIGSDDTAMDILGAFLVIKGLGDMSTMVGMVRSCCGGGELVWVLVSMLWLTWNSVWIVALAVVDLGSFPGCGVTPSNRSNSSQCSQLLFIPLSTQSRYPKSYPFSYSSFLSFPYPKSLPSLMACCHSNCRFWFPFVVETALTNRFMSLKVAFLMKNTKSNMWCCSEAIAAVGNEMGGCGASVEIVRDNPGVFPGYPYPYPSQPLPPTVG